jgi:hypothetical protein
VRRRSDGASEVAAARSGELGQAPREAARSELSAPRMRPLFREADVLAKRGTG